MIVAVRGTDYPTLIEVEDRFEQRWWKAFQSFIQRFGGCDSKLRGLVCGNGCPKRQGNVVDHNINLWDNQLALAFGLIEDIQHAPVQKSQVDRGYCYRPVFAKRMQ
jgi:hypothetical protein